jgi:nitrogen regulatory protein PII
MHTEHRKLITIVMEAALEQRLIKDLKKLGANGYTITDARGKGSRGVRNASWDRSGNIRVEVLCDEACAYAIAMHLKEHYFDDIAMVLFISDVAVLRPQKF